MQTFNLTHLTHLTLATALAVGCSVHDDARPVGDAPLSERQLEELEDLGIHGVIDRGEDVLLLSEGGLEVGAVTREGPRVAVELGDEAATIHRHGSNVTLECSSEADAAEIPAAELAAFVDRAPVAAACTRALAAARIVTSIDTAVAPGCELEIVDGQQVLACDDVEDEYRLLGFDCGCVGDGWGWCPPSCYSCAGAWESSAVCEDHEGGGGGGGGSSGGGWGYCSQQSGDYPGYAGGYVKFPGGDFTEFCATAKTRAENACKSAGGPTCKATVTKTTFQEGGCGVALEGWRYCDCFYTATCNVKKK